MKEDKDKILDRELNLKDTSFAKELGPLIKQAIKGFALCVHCKGPMSISLGQEVYWHKECRKDGRKNRYRNLKRDRSNK